VSLSAWRIVKAEFSAGAFSGEGARLFGGRWNSKGTSIVYTAQSASLAALELLVHLQRQQLLEAYVVARVSFDEALAGAVEAVALPAGWQDDPPPPALRRIGDEWAAALRSAVLRVPSAVVEDEFNYLLNPAHPDFAGVAIDPFEPFRFDPRLAK
jgi:RES domain-containing protein